MPNNERALSPGIQLGVICLRHWLQCVQDEGTGTCIPYHESDRVVKAIAQGINALYQQVDGEESELTGARLEQEIIDAVPWIWWRNFPPIEFQGHRLFEPTTAQGWIESSVHGGSNFNKRVRVKLQGVDA